jgi:peptidoglycan/xylan/chitin deacetylase (PgdA/CDA1 family)
MDAARPAYAAAGDAAPASENPTATMTPAPTPATTPAAATPTPAPLRLPFFPNEVGEIMILLYHGLTEDTPNEYDRSIADFKNDLQALYDGGYRLTPLGALIENRITTAAGYTPVVLTFDDGRASAFSLIRDENGVLTPAPDCAVGIIEAFYAEHPDFGKAATFFINGQPEPFRGEGTLAERFAYLIENGYELGNHSYTHADFSNLGGARLQEEIGRLDALIRSAAPGYEPAALAYPYSNRPHSTLRELVGSGVYEGRAYNYLFALRVGYTGAPASPNHIRFDPYNVSRALPTDDSAPGRDVRDLGSLLRYFDERPLERYVSDGDPHTLAVPEDRLHLVNMDSLGDIELIVYDPRGGFLPKN